MFIINTFSTYFGHHYAHLQENKTCVTANIYLSPLVTAQHTTCSNTRLVLLKMGIMMPETCWESVDNKHLSVASCWFSLSLHNFIHRLYKIKCMQELIEPLLRTDVKHNYLVAGSQMNWWYFIKFKKKLCHKKNEGRFRRTYTQRNFLKFAVLLWWWGNFYRKVKFSMTID